MKKSWIPPLFAVLALSACGKSEDAAKSALPPPPAPAVQTPPAPTPTPPPVETPAPAPAAEAAPAAPAPAESSAAATQSAGSGDTYVVAKGDTLYSIAKAHSVDVHELAQWNNLSDPNMLRVGKKLRFGAAK